MEMQRVNSDALKTGILCPGRGVASIRDSKWAELS